MESKFEEFSENATLHGSRYACGGRSHVVHRVFWVCAILGMMVLFSIQFALSLVNFFKYETYTSIQVLTLKQPMLSII